MTLKIWLLLPQTHFNKENFMKINTSTTAGKIAVMQAWEDRVEVQFDNYDGLGWVVLTHPSKPAWNWSDCRYRIKPRTVEEAADEYLGSCLRKTNDVLMGFIAGSKWREENPISPTD